MDAQLQGPVATADAGGSLAKKTEKIQVDR
jgi:hypothetical protein